MTPHGLLTLVLLLLLVVFTAQNYALVEVELLLWSFRTSRAILIFVVLTIGIVIGWLTASRRGRRGHKGER